MTPCVCLCVCLCASLRRFHDLLSEGRGGLGEHELAAFYLTQDMMAHAAFLAIAAQSLTLLDRYAALPYPTLPYPVLSRDMVPIATAEASSCSSWTGTGTGPLPPFG